jgi:hypothetical protein
VPTLIRYPQTDLSRQSATPPAGASGAATQSPKATCPTKPCISEAFSVLCYEFSTGLKLPPGPSKFGPTDPWASLTTSPTVSSLRRGDSSETTPSAISSELPLSPRNQGMFNTKTPSPIELILLKRTIHHPVLSILLNRSDLNYHGFTTTSRSKARSPRSPHARDERKDAAQWILRSDKDPGTAP